MASVSFSEFRDALPKSLQEFASTVGEYQGDVKKPAKEVLPFLQKAELYDGFTTKEQKVLGKTFLEQHKTGSASEIDSAFCSHVLKSVKGDKEEIALIKKLALGALKFNRPDVVETIASTKRKFIKKDPKPIFDAAIETGCLEVINTLVKNSVASSPLVFLEERKALKEIFQDEKKIDLCIDGLKKRVSNLSDVEQGKNLVWTKNYFESMIESSASSGKELEELIDKQRKVLNSINNYSEDPGKRLEKANQYQCHRIKELIKLFAGK